VIHEPLTTSIDTLVLESSPTYGGFCSNIGRCLRQLQFNSLRSLEIYSEFSGTHVPQSNRLLELVSQYRSLTSLRLYNVALSDNSVKDTLELLESLTSLESLEVVEGNSKKAKPEDDNCLRTSFVEGLTVSQVGDHHPSQQGTPILPVLRHLILEAQGTYLTDRSLVDLVCSRWCPSTSDPGVDTPAESGSVTSLSSVRFVLTKRRCDAEVFQPLVDIAAAGLNVAVIDSFGRVV
jgi:hypothetical protein